MKDLVRKVWYFDIQDNRLPVIVSYVLWSYFYPLQSYACHILNLAGLEEELPDGGLDGWEQCFNEHVSNPMNYICLNAESRAEFMKRNKKPTLQEGFEEFKAWLAVQGVGEKDNFVVAMWW